MGFPLDHPCIRQAIERGLIRAEDVHPVTPAPTPAPRPKPPAVSITVPVAWSITLTLPCRVVSEANRRDHWAVSKRRADSQAVALRHALDAAGLTHHKPPLPLAVTWTRTGTRKLDDDNLTRAFKALRDRLAEWIGFDDGDERIGWRYDQKPGKPGVHLTIKSQAS